MVRWISFLAAVGLIVLLGGCARSGTGASVAMTPEATAVSTAAATASQPYADVITRWLEGVPCRAPCWEGITPGVTTREEALDLLGANQLVDLPWYPSSRTSDWIDWTWVGIEDGGGDLRTEDGTVSMILGALPQEVALRDVIGAYGEPSHIVAVRFMGLHGEGPFYILSLAWEPAGFALDTGFLYHQEPLLNEDSPFLNLYFSPSPEVILPALRGGTGALVPWEGFKDFAAYCRTEHGNPCS